MAGIIKPVGNKDGYKSYETNTNLPFVALLSESIWAGYPMVGMANNLQGHDRNQTHIGQIQNRRFFKRYF